MRIRRPDSDLPTPLACVFFPTAAMADVGIGTRRAATASQQLRAQ